MKKTHSPNKSNVRLRSRTASEELIRSINKTFSDKKIPIATLTALSKKYGHRANKPDSQLFKRLGDGKSVSAQKLTEYLAEATHHEKGKQLSDEAIKRAHSAFCNPEGKMTFDFLMKRCEELGIQMSERVAKGIVRKYGQRKDHLTAEDCAKVLHRRYAQKKGQRQTPPRK